MMTATTHRAVYLALITAAVVAFLAAGHWVPALFVTASAGVRCWKSTNHQPERSKQ